MENNLTVEEISKLAQEVEDQVVEDTYDVFFSEKQQILLENCGVEPPEYRKAFRNWPTAREFFNKAKDDRQTLRRRFRATSTERCRAGPATGTSATLAQGAYANRACRFVSTMDRRSSTLSRKWK